MATDSLDSLACVWLPVEIDRITLYWTSVNLPSLFLAHPRIGHGVERFDGKLSSAARESLPCQELMNLPVHGESSSEISYACGHVRCQAWCHRSKLAGTALAVTSEKLAPAAPTKQASNQQPPTLHLVTLSLCFSLSVWSPLQ